MNDRFRFRVWDKSFCRMIYNIFFFWKENTITVYELHKDASKSYLPNSHIVLEQCTGLKDKNGRLIYEGDIVEYTFYANRALYGNYGDYKYKGVIRRETNGFNTESYADKIEVIGNIHENPELLEDK